jgi:hypothetical protein
MSQFISILLRSFALLLLALDLTACAAAPQQVIHSFSFDGQFDKWSESIDLLAYSYGDQYNMVRNSIDNPRSPVFKGRSALPPSTGVNGPMPVGEFLYVKWRLKSTREVIEDRVDLRKLLPRNMANHGITFVIDGRQLYVYLVTPKFKKDSVPPHLKTYLSDLHVAYEIYPANTYQQASE